MILSFGDGLAEDLFYDRRTNRTRRLSGSLREVARRKLLYVHEASELRDLRAPPGNRLEVLRGSWEGYHSIRINEQWRIVFRWEEGHAASVRVVDYHK
jgi:proteic killer suppression protein